WLADASGGEESEDAAPAGRGVRGARRRALAQESLPPPAGQRPRRRRGAQGPAPPPLLRRAPRLLRLLPRLLLHRDAALLAAVRGVRVPSRPAAADADRPHD